MNIKNVKRIRKSICKGCLTYENMTKDIMCNLPHKKNGHSCPCSTCLIKSVCIKSCDLIEEYKVDSKNIYRGNDHDSGGQKNCKIRQPKMPWDSLC